MLDFSKNDIMRFVELGILTVVALLLIFFVLRPLLKTAAGGGANLPALAGANGGEMFSRKETLDLIQAYYQLGERPRRRLLDLAKSLHTEGDTVAS